MEHSSTNSFILASGSPRRSFLLRACRFDFTIEPSHASEDFEPSTPAEEVPRLLAIRKAEASRKQHPNSKLIVTADTVVVLKGKILNKPSDESEAIRMLSELSNNTHLVITAVALSTPNHLEVMECRSLVHFLPLDDQAIKKYVQNFRPLDKAGAYGAQECLPDTYNPCSEEETQFLETIGSPNLLEHSKPERSDHEPLIAIRKIEGSYFNVMGLPIHLICKNIHKIIQQN